MSAATPGSLPRLVLFDVGNVLLSLRPWQEVFAAAGGVVSGKEAASTLDAFLETGLLDRFERGMLDIPAFCQALRGSFGVSLDDDAICASYLLLLGDPVEGMVELIRELKERGVRVAGLSDTSTIHLPALACYAAVQELERLVASCEIGHCKPEVDAFVVALDQLQVSAGDVFFTDDKEENVEGARRAGLRGSVFGGADRLRAELGL